jgi:hypothetical protein
VCLSLRANGSRCSVRIPCHHFYLRRSVEMPNVNRRAVIKTAAGGAVAAGTSILAAAASGAEPKAPELWTLEGGLKVHPKFIYRFYLVILDGQKCALYGVDHSREPDQLARLQLPVNVRVRGVLGTEHHAGGTKQNPSPFPAGWTLYMDVHEVEPLE